jgi:2-C-methyl-D-erythritol 4-phosphate cytidylyltransferase
MVHPKKASHNSVVAVVPAAGMGTRVGLGPKAFLKLGEGNLLFKVVHTLSNCVDSIVVGVPYDYLGRARDEFRGLAEVFPGGSSRQETVFMLLNQCTEQIVLIHDVTRAFASPSLIQQVIHAGKKYGAAVSCILSYTPVATCKDNVITGSIPRSRIRLTQSPQVFHRNILERAYKKALETGLETQTTWELVVQSGIPVRAVMGEERNIKITTPFDWEIATKVLEPK